MLSFKNIKMENVIKNNETTVLKKVSILQRKRRRLRAFSKSYIKRTRKGRRRYRRNKIKMSKEHLNYVKTRLQRLNYPKVQRGVLTIKQTRRNCFMNISKEMIKRKRQKFQIKISKKPQHKVLIHKSIGQCTIYKGRAKSSAVAKKSLATAMAQFVHKKQIRIIDARFISELNRASGPLLTTFASKNIIFRSLQRILLRPHGYVRKKKARRI